MTKIRKSFASLFLLAIILISFVSCKKDKLEEVSIIKSGPPTQPYNTPLSNFYNALGVAEQTDTISGTAGGTFTTPQGTIVTIPPNAFVNLDGTPVTEKITIKFKDIYKKSDMLLSNAPSQTALGPLKSAGEFFIMGLQAKDNSPVSIAVGKNIFVQQPSMGKAMDTLMTPFELNPTILSTTNNKIWQPVSVPTFTVIKTDTIRFPPQLHPDVYIYGMYQFKTPNNTGSWYNTANSNYFLSTPKTNLTIHPNFDTTGYYINIFLVFTNVTSTVAVYKNVKSNASFTYQEAPLNEKCTVVALATKKDTIYSSFIPLTISADKIINFELVKTSPIAFKTALRALD
jgi:hypothetical protein